MNVPEAVALRSTLRPDLLLIADMVAPGARVLDVGCGDGALLRYLAREKGVIGRGMELSQAGVNACVAQGLSVVQGDADADLGDYPSQAFDFVILSQTLQATHRPKQVLVEMLRIGRHGIVSFPNFGHWRVRWRLFLGGRMPLTPTLPDPWYETPNIHLCTIRDFVTLCDEQHIRIDHAIGTDREGRARMHNATSTLANLMAEQALFLLCRG